MSVARSGYLATDDQVYRRGWASRHELEMEVFSYIEGFYNSRRRHSRLDNLSPLDYEQRYLTQKQVSA